jgi:hypothetical protein
MLTVAEQRIQWLALLVRPIARFCLRHSLQSQDLVEAVKIALLHAAEQELKKSNCKQNLSRLSVLTGLQRKDLRRLLALPEQSASAKGLLTKVIGAWQYQKPFCAAEGKPRALSLKQGDNQFEALVRGVSSDLNPGTVLFELERSKLVERKGETVHLLNSAYIPQKQLTQGFEMLAEDSQDLLCSVESNLFSLTGAVNLHARTEFDNIHPEAIPVIRRFLFREGRRLHSKVRKLLAKHDQDLHPRRDSSGIRALGVRVKLGTFGLIDEEHRC